MITIKDFTFYYNKKRPIFDNVSFTMKSGIYGLLGENGVGKTTLLHCISGLRFPREGSCKVDDYEACYRNPNMLQQLFFLPEEFQGPAISIDTFAKVNASFYPNFSDEQFRQYLNEFHVESDRKMSELSFGQKKKALISYALALNTPITLLDEPTNGLDIPSKAQFRKIISAAFSDEKIILISTHQVRDLESLIDPIIILDRNQVLLNNSVQEITDKLLFSITPTVPEGAFYWEHTMQGFVAVSPNHNKEESTMNIEALFNAVVSNKATFKNLFNA
ncbi:ATP-binding cassette domain-containing protein [Dysgonomonas sp. 25]|uniref:ABC transporter ATP-binding protein n=1 Tax=Dysgonomonas sp. 25 TaxID=2302933 RepID=UPI0013D0E232|nr:ABC transporter ATP-binding protein [Dysgonomonas sp. 25]NDV68195.1 ABC transporter ATP-binding protein [Dysgonomonas sp. 25]